MSFRYAFGPKALAPLRVEGAPHGSLGANMLINALVGNRHLFTAPQPVGDPLAILLMMQFAFDPPGARRGPF